MGTRTSLARLLGCGRRPSASSVLLCLLPVLSCVGCGEPALEFTEVKRIDEPVGEAELRAYLRVVAALPEEQPPEVRPVFLPPPRWSPERTLPVAELVAEERRKLDERWSTSWQAARLGGSMTLRRALRREAMTVEQFVGLTLTLGTAFSRVRLPDERKIAEVLRRGAPILDRLSEDERPFSSISPEGRHDVLSRALWIARVDRASHLKMVPTENLELVEQHREALEKALPEEFTADPFADVADPLTDYGVPFIEEPASGRDDRIRWTREEAIVGKDE